MKILHSADWHIGNFPGPETDGVNSRLLDTLNCIDELIAVAEREKVDLTLISGDIFNQARVWSDRGILETLVAIGKIRALAQVAPVVAMRGTPNHDGGEQFHALSLFFKNAPSKYPVYVSMEPEVIDISTPHEMAQVATVPGFDRGYFRAKCPGISRESECQIFTEELGKIVLGFRAGMQPEGSTKILMAHYMVPGCNMESGQTQFFSGVDPILLPATLDAAQYDLVALGHIHRPQQLQSCRNAFYSGAVNAFNFNDEGQERGFYIHNTDTGEHTFFPTPYRRFCTMDWNDCEITAILNGDIDDVSHNWWIDPIKGGSSIKGEIVRVLYECSAEKEKAFNRALVEDRLKQDGAFWVAGVSPSNITADASRKELSEQSAPEANLRDYLMEKTYLDNDIARIIEAARPIIAKATAGSSGTSLAGVFTPLTIEVENYRNYAKESFDFSNITFCTINGHNGAGKSSLFMDAILDCLYEEPREGELTGWIRAAEDARSGSITFSFRIGEKTYRVCRTRTKSGKATLNLSELVDGDWQNRSCEKTRDTQAAIIAVLGMDSLTFRSCALIMQDQYGIFLQADKESRMNILGNILGLDMYGVMEALARERLGDNKRAIAQAKDRRLRLDGDMKNTQVPEEQFSALQVQIDVNETRRGKVQADKDALHSAVLAGEAAAKRLEEIRRDLANLQAAEQTLKSKRAELGATVAQAQNILSRADTIRAGMKSYEELKAHVAKTSAQNDLFMAKSAELVNVNRDLQALETARQGIIAKKDALLREIEQLQQKLGDIDRLRALSAEYDAVRVQLANMEQKSARYENLRNEIDTVRQVHATANAQFREEASRRKEAIEGMQKRVALLEECGCVDIARASCKFLSDAKDAQAGLEPYRQKCTVWKSSEEQRLSELAERVHKLVQEAEALGYDPEGLRRLRDQSAALERDKKALDEIPAIETKVEMLRDNVQAYDSQIADNTRQHSELLTRQTSITQEVERLRKEAELLTHLQSQLQAAAHWQTEMENLNLAEERLKNASDRLAEIEIDLSENSRQVVEKQVEAKIQQTAMRNYEADRCAYIDCDLELQSLDKQLADQRQLLGAYKHRQEAAARILVEIKTLDAEVTALGISVSDYEVLKIAFSQDGIPHNIIRSILPILTSTANNILGQMTGGRMGMDFVTEKVMKSNAKKEVVTLDILIHEYGKDTLPYLSKSGGEKVKASLSAILALAETKSSQAGIQLGMLFIDEPPFLDQDGIQAYCDALETIQRRYPNIKIMAITHDPAMKSRFPQSVDVVKDATGSRVEMN